MILLKTQGEIELIRDSARLLGKTLAEVSRHIHPGVTTAFLDKIGDQFIRDNGGIPLCKGYEGFPAAFCISVRYRTIVFPPAPNTQEMRTMKCLSRASRTAVSPASLLLP